MVKARFHQFIAEYRKLASEGNWVCKPMISDYDSVKKTKGAKYAEKFIKAKYYDSF